MNIYLTSLGCRLNEAELGAWAREFRRRGYRITRYGGEAADLVVLNTCAVTSEAVRKSRQLIRKVQRDNPNAKLVVSGCYASLPGTKPDLPGIDLLVDNVDKDQLPEITIRELALPIMPALASEPGENALFARGRNRSFVKVQDGCRHRCTFCIVTQTRGEERSRGVADIVEEINHQTQAGFTETELTGVHLGGYGKDLSTDFHALIKTILRDTDVPRLRLGSLEPWDLHEDFLQLFENHRLMPHLHLPLQSGCDSVLRRMGRRCDTANFAQLIETARRKIDDLSITSDIIVGFPGETEKEWQTSRHFIEAIGFAHLHIFSYSPRAGTRAATLPNQIPFAQKRRRSRELHALATQMKRQFLSVNLDREVDVLWESTTDGTLCAGYTPNYIRVRVVAPEPKTLGNLIRKASLV